MIKTINNLKIADRLGSGYWVLTPSTQHQVPRLNDDEMTNGFPAKLIIEKERVLTENWNRPHGNGLIDPSNFSPFPKNPVIAKFFKEIGRVDELGSGVRNAFKYTGIYTAGAKPEFMEGDVFKTIIPIEYTKAVIQEGGQKRWSEKVVRRSLLPGVSNLCLI